MTIVVFTGPSLPHHEARPLIDAVLEPPAKAGDIIRALDYAPRAIGIIDGFFEVVPAVWHKEILFAMNQGVRVLGAASMGALRAAELQPFGMEGVGAIFDAYVNGTLEDDDEVAVCHGPEELGYPVLTEPMVNIRRTLADALAGRVISPETRRALETIAKALYYKDRTYNVVLRSAEVGGVNGKELRAFSDWLLDGRFDQKREDAILLISRLKSLEMFYPPATPHYHFEETVFWTELSNQ